MNANEKLTALADEVRKLSGTTTTKGLDDMKNDVDAANAEIAGQVTLIAQITAALEGKTGGTASEDLNAELTEYASLNTEFEEVINSLPNAGGGGTGGSIETCTLTINMDEADYHPFCFVTVLAGSQATIQSVTSSTTISNVIKNSRVIFMVPEGRHYSLDFHDGGAFSSIIYIYLTLDGDATIMEERTIINNGTLTFF